MQLDDGIPDEDPENDTIVYQNRQPKNPRFSPEPFDERRLDLMRDRLSENTNSMYCPESQVILASKNPILLATGEE
jgi:hypothetical protein